MNLTLSQPGIERKHLGSSIFSPISLALKNIKLTNISGYHSRVAWGNFTPTPSQVGSGIGAPTVGSGGSSKAFAVGLSPAPLVTFPTPATSNPAYGFPVPGFPANFTYRFMRPITLAVLSGPVPLDPIVLE